MFEEVARTSRPGRLFRRSAFVVASTAVEAAVVLALAVGGRSRAAGRPEPVVEVRLVRAAPAPPPLGLPLRRAASERPREAKKPARTAMVQPKAVRELPPPEPPPAPPEPLAAAEAASGFGGSPEGVVGGVLGGEGFGAAPPHPDPPPTVDFRDEMTPPRLLGGPALEYTPDAIDHGVEGLMVVRCVVTAEGRVHGCRVLQGLPFMDRAVVAVLEGRRYAPAMLHGAPLEVNYTFKIRMRLPR